MKKIKIGNSIFSIVSTEDDDYLDGIGNVFEPHMVQLFSALVEPNDVVADIGANIGLTAILFSSLVKKVYAFEPSPTTFHILQKNLEINNVSNVEPINLGLGDKKESLTITFAKSFRAGAFVSNKIQPGNGHVTENINIDTLDDFFMDKDPKPTFLKIDVEGFEQNVIKGGGTILKKIQPTVVMEMNHFCLNVLQRITIPDFLDFMRSVFPFLYAIDTDNRSIMDLHNPDQSYTVMHEHVVKHRFPNLVGAFEPTIKTKLYSINDRNDFSTPPLGEIKGSIHFISDTVPSVRPGEKFSIVIEIANNGNEDWLCEGTRPVNIAYHWRDMEGNVVVYDGVRTPLPGRILRAGDTVRAAVLVEAPKVTGRFILELTLVQEMVCWFEQRGFEVARIEVEVINK